MGYHICGNWVRDEIHITENMPVFPVLHLGGCVGPAVNMNSSGRDLFNLLHRSESFIKFGQLSSHLAFVNLSTHIDHECFDV